ncbi:UPF0145 domain-containing protein [Fusarium heterosporum]|uniref:UPF0145 domain-containing protein n=1 Tax=Fusarium heterosporum TaxID=42747 RepID=A0A8H5WZS0_FUSHE|nr:UPF0145 domain-containing protein [Fusarium heterosporum]
MVSFGSSKEQKKNHDEVADIPAHLSDLHCFTETDNCITTSKQLELQDPTLKINHYPPAMMDLPGYRITKVLGAVYGITVRSRNIAAGIAMVIKSMAGGELNWFTSMLYSCRNDSISRVVQETKRRGGNAIICLRFETGDLGGFAQASAYGTACVVEKIEGATVDATQLTR